MTRLEPSDHERARALLDRVPGLPPEEQAAALEALFRHPSADIRGPTLHMGSAILSDDQIVAYLRNAADDVLRNVALEMLKIRGAKAVPVCVHLLGDRDQDVVLQAVLALDHSRDPRALGPLRQLLGHTNTNVAQAVILAIGKVGHGSAARDLFPFLEGDPWLQFAAIEALGTMRAPEAVEPLSRLLTDEVVGPLAAEALVRIGGTSAFAALAPAWMDKPEDDSGLEFLAHVLEGLLEDPPCVDGFREAVAGRMASDGARSAAARCLLALGPGREDRGALDVIGEAPDDHLTLPACLARRHDLIGPLLDSRGKHNNWGFLLAVRYPESVPVASLAGALSTHRGHASLDAIADVLSVVESHDLGGAILGFYDRLPEDVKVGWGPILRRHREAILPELDRRAGLSAETQAVLGVVLHPSVAEVASGITALPPTQRVAALGHVSDWDDVCALLPWIEWIQQAPERFAPVAAEAASRAGWEDHLPELRAVLLDRPTPDLVRLVARLGDDSLVPPLVGLLGQGKPELHPFIIDALGTLGGAKARQALRSVTASGDASWERLAVMALARCATKDDQPFFRELIGHSDWQVRLACADVLARSDREEDRPALVQLFADPVPVVARRVAAVLEH